MVSLNSSNTYGMFAGGIWGPGGVAAADDGTVYALTGNATGDPAAYWGALPAAGPGSLGDYFNALVRVGVEVSGVSSNLAVLDWFQGSTFTKAENDADWDFGGSSPVVLPPINGRQLVAFVPKDGDIFVLDSQNLGQYSVPLTRVTFANAFNSGGNDTKVAIAFMQTPDGRNVLIVGADSNGASLGRICRVPGGCYRDASHLDEALAVRIAVARLVWLAHGHCQPCAKSSQPSQSRWPCLGY